MIQKFLILSFLVFLFALPSISQAENTLVFSDSSKSILKAMDMAVNGNYRLYTLEEFSGDTTYKFANESKPAKLKSSAAAFLVALVPGSVVHGAGHFYAGKSKAGFLLLGAEIIGAGLCYLSALGNLAGNTKKGSSDGTAFIGLTLFVGSWIYDIIEAPLAVHYKNQKILGKDPFEL
jgi:hypothetical protein